MKIFNSLIILVAISFSTLSCNNNVTPEIKTVEMEPATTAVVKLDPNAHYAKAEFGIEGMTCAMGCAKTIEKKIARMDGVKSASVDFDTRLAMVEYDDAKVNLTSIEAAVKATGDAYSVKDMKTVEDFSTPQE